MTQTEMDYLLSRLGQALMAAANSLIGSAGAGDASGTSPDSGSTSSGENSSSTDSNQADPEPIVIDTVPALGEVGVIARRAPLRSAPTKDIDVDLGRLLEGERVPLDTISENKKWYRVDVRNFAGKHTVPDNATYAWGEASNFEIIKLN